ncbi:hypothetical protein [Actinacidiphila sp. bgisy167]|uniref:hypothetical protein n=1 Tax=Actinacidiphila sp. bgisy167 TaxID=3413797 RepID=UPI003D7465F1
MTASSVHSTADLSSLAAGTRDDLRAYAELGGFTLTADTHAWYAAADTVAGPEEARAASTVLAELRNRDLPALTTAARRLGEAEALGIEAPRTVAECRTAVSLLMRVRQTLRTLSADAYDVAEAELDELVAATARGAWRRQRGVKVGWLRRRSLRGRARGLVSGRQRRDAVHTALASAATERTDWAALGGSGRPAVPADADFLDEASQAAEAAATGLTELGRLLRPDAALDTLPFDELARLLDRLAADEGTLYRLPNLKATRQRLEERGLGTLLAELTERRADAAEVGALLVEAAEAETPAVPEPRVTSDAEEEPEGEGQPTQEAEDQAEPAPAAEAPAAEPEAVTAEAEAASPAPEAAPVEAEPVVHASGAEDVRALEVVAPAEHEPDAVVAPAPEPEAVVAPAPEPEAVVAPAPEPTPEPEAVVAPTPEPVAAPSEPVAASGPAAAKKPPRRPRKPKITPGQAVTAYSAKELAALVRWIDSDGEERSDDALLRAAMKELGFARLGPRIKEALGAAVAEVRG